MGAFDWMFYARPLCALVLVASLIILCAAMIKKLELDKRLTGNKNVRRRLSVVETLYLDPKRRLVIVRCGDREHLLLVGVTGELLIESCASVKDAV